ncbi:hypothetical protein [Pyrococcus yayanosii]|uniref:Uncharacterized protein n=1 Tax=Pyrococcus yayanosii (strain CH1 / JCM 16557) TaxID=529709 RepID=F8AEF8_PYRYC|nr:hypothetical protein [Pyrococcus yayanosii]AEH25469.1 hypothetical protein PYCH_18140 [Pyrococcus yayanosii CH1]
MPVLGINVLKVEYEKKGAVIGRVEVSLNPKIEDMRLGEMIFPNGKVNGIEVALNYEVQYSPNIATGRVKLMVFYLPRDRDKVDEILDMWESEKKIPPELFTEVVNFTTVELMPLLIAIAKEMKIPYPIPVPRIAVRKEEG